MRLYFLRVCIFGVAYFNYKSTVCVKEAIKFLNRVLLKYGIKVIRLPPFIKGYTNEVK